MRLFNNISRGGKLKRVVKWIKRAGWRKILKVVFF